MLQMACYARLSEDVTERKSDDGNPMGTTVIRIDTSPCNSDSQESLWLSATSYDEQAVKLLVHSEGDVVSLHGTVTQHTWVDQDGEERAGLSLTVGSIVSERTVHLGGGTSQKQPADDSTNITIPEAFG